MNRCTSAFLFALLVSSSLSACGGSAADGALSDTSSDLLAGSTAVPGTNAAASTDPRPFTCTMKKTEFHELQALSGTLDANGAPHQVLVTRANLNEFGPVDPASYNGFPFNLAVMQKYNLNGYDLGTRPADTFGPRQAYIGLPKNQSNAPGSTFRLYLRETWLPANGVVDVWFACTVS